MGVLTLVEIVGYVATINGKWREDENRILKSWELEKVLLYFDEKALVLHRW